MTHQNLMPLIDIMHRHPHFRSWRSLTSSNNRFSDYVHDAPRNTSCQAHSTQVQIQHKSPGMKHTEIHLILDNVTIFNLFNKIEGLKYRQI